MAGATRKLRCSHTKLFVVREVQSYFYTVLGKPPINSAAGAVRAAIVAENRRQP